MICFRIAKSVGHQGNDIELIFTLVSFVLRTLSTGLLVCRLPHLAKREKGHFAISQMSLLG